MQTLPLLQFNNIDLILPKEENLGALYLGNMQAAKDIKLLEEKDISAVLSVTPEIYFKYDKLTHLIIKISMNLILVFLK